MNSTAIDADELGRLFAEYRADRSRQVRNRIIEAHRGLAIHIARRYANRGLALDDLVQVAQLGILKAVERFDPERGYAFVSFASATVHGELKRHFRDRSWSVRVPRSVQEKHLALGHAIADLTQRNQRAPTVAELADELRCTEDEVLDAMEAGAAYNADSIDAMASDRHGRGRLEQTVSEIEAGFADAEQRVVVERLLESVGETERRVLTMRFFHEMTQSQIAEELGVSQMQVSRLLSRTLTNLRARLSHEPSGEVSGAGGS